jgi:hypothetical protein
MASRHLKPEGRSPRIMFFVVAGSFAVAFVAIVAAFGVHVIGGSPTAAREAIPPAVTEQPISQQGRLLAVSPTSVTAQSADGFARTYVINAQTNAITEQGSVIGGAATTFAVDDEVSIVGVVSNGTAIATAVAGQRVSNLDGPPMDTGV